MKYESLTAALVAALPLLGILTAACDGDPCTGRDTTYAGDATVGAGSRTPIEDLRCAEVVTGDLIVSETNLVELAALERLVHVQGDLRFVRNEALTSFEALSSLQRVDGNLIIRDNSSLQSLRGLEALTVVGNSVEIDSDDGLRDLEGLGALTSVSGHVRISNNGGLRSLDGFAPQHVGGSLEIASNRSLEDLGLVTSGMVIVERSLVIADNESLREIDSLPSLHGDRDGVPSGAIASYGQDCGDLPGLFIHLNQSLERVEGGDVGSDFDGCLELHFNPELREVVLSYQFDHLYDLSIVGSPKLESLTLGANSEVVGVTHIDNNFEIRDTGLTTLDELSRLRVVGCMVMIDDNPELQRLGLSALERTAFLSLDENPELDPCVQEALVAQLRVSTLEERSPECDVSSARDSVLLDVPLDGCAIE